VRLLDFGIARLLSTPVGLEPALGRTTGRQWMTPEYAAPEQIRGEPVTTATDVYQLGVVLFELLSDRRPFERDGGSLHELEQAVLTREPERPSAAARRRRRPSTSIAVSSSTALDQAPGVSHDDRLDRILRGDLDAIVLKALRKEPPARYASVRDLARDIEHYSRGLPVAARLGSTAYRARKFVRRHRWGVGMATAFVLLLAGYAVTVTVEDARVRQALAEARIQRDAAIHERERAEAQIEFQSLLMSQIGDRPMTMREIVDRGREALERQYAGDPRFLGEMLLQLSELYGALGDGNVRRHLLGRAESLASAVRADAQLAEIRCHLADHLRTEGRYDEAWKILKAVDSIRARLSDTNVDETCLQMRTMLAYENGNAAESKAAILELLAIKESRGHVRDASYFEALNALGKAFQAEGRFRDALETYRRADSGLDSSGRAETLLRTVIQHNSALVLVKVGETAEAERVLQEVLRRMARSDPSGFIHPQPLIHYAEAALTQGHADSAAKYFGQLLAQAVRDTSRYWQGRASFGLARAQARLGRLEEARRTAATLRRVSYNFPELRETDDQLPDSTALDGWVALAEGDTGVAHEHFMGSLRSNRYFEGERKNQQRAVVLQTAETALWLGRADSALALSRQVRAIASRDSLTETRSAFVGEARLVEGRTLLAIGDTLQALNAVRMARIALRNGAGDAHHRTREAEALLQALRASPAVGGRR
jgi:serine/threonine-protein kinase